MFIYLFIYLFNYLFIRKLYLLEVMLLDWIIKSKIIKFCLSKMHEKHRQKTHILNEVADQRPANSIKILSLTGTLPTPNQSKLLTQPPYKPALRQERVNTKQVDMKTLTLNPP